MKAVKWVWMQKWKIRFDKFERLFLKRLCKWKYARIVLKSSMKPLKSNNWSVYDIKKDKCLAQRSL